MISLACEGSNLIPKRSKVESRMVCGSYCFLNQKGNSQIAVLMDGLGAWRKIFVSSICSSIFSSPNLEAAIMEDYYGPNYNDIARKLTQSGFREHFE